MTHLTPLIRRFAIPSCFLLTGLLLLLWPALYNGYPLVYSDTGTYLLSSVTLQSFPDRPIGYGIFIRIFGWQATTWPVIVAQGLIIYCITLRVTRLFFIRCRLFHLTILAFLAGISSLPWYAAQLMPDVFAGILILAIYLFFYDADNLKKRLVYGLVIGFIALFHYSFFVIAFLTGGLVVLLHIRYLFTKSRKIVYAFGTLAGFLALSVLTIMTIHYAEKGQFRFSFSSNVFLTAKFCDGKILYTYLHDNCGRKDVPYCGYKDSLPDCPSAFLWNDRSPFALEDHYNWESANERCAVIVHDVFTTPKYRKLFLIEAWNATRAQIEQNRIGSGLVAYGANGSPGNVLSTEFEGEFGQYMRSRQNSGRENMEDLTINRFNQRILRLSLLIILAGLCYRPVRRSCWRLLVICLLGVVFNAFVTAALANVYDRLQARVTWLLIFGALIALGIVVQRATGMQKSAPGS
jgi:hypothetical protein